ncbi:MAG TPA: TRAP transporter small permease subunit [Beijerinckiaceae bacterium]|jgi:TRAP-type mannitol/chloroaromatic compound transport system permease small subunit
MKALLAFSRAVDRLSGAAGYVADWLVLFACLVSAGNAAIRYLFSYSSNGWLEIQWYMFGALVFLGASHTLRMNEHVRVDLVYSSVSDRARLWIDTIGFVVFFLPVTIYLTWLSIPFFKTSLLSGEYSSNAGGLILWPIKLVIPLGLALLTLQGFSELIKRIAALEGEVKLDTHYEKPLQ